MKMYGDTHPGNVRDHNEDAFVCEPDNKLALIADGMGGHAAGEVAAQITVNVAKELAGKKADLSTIMMESHERIMAHANEHVESRGMGCAAVAAQLNEKSVTVCWVGDSRAYLFSKDNGLQALSSDHSYVQWLLSNGQISEHQARIHPDRNLVTQCLGIQPPEPEENTSSWQFGDKILLCSDGLTDELEDTEIEEILAGSVSIENCTAALIQAALNKGGKDNVTVLLVENTFKPVQERAHDVATTDVKEKPWLAIAASIGLALAIAAAWFLLR